MGLGGFSWKRAVGISSAKAKISREIGIPLTKSGRQRKLGKIIEDAGLAPAATIMGAGKKQRKNSSEAMSETYNSYTNIDREFSPYSNWDFFKDLVKDGLTDYVWPLVKKIWGVVIVFGILYLWNRFMK